MSEIRTLRRPTSIPLTHKEQTIPEAVDAIWKILAELQPCQRDQAIAQIRTKLRTARKEGLHE